MIIVSTECYGRNLIAWAEWLGQDLCVTMSGGDERHIGSVSLGIPRKSLDGDGKNSATVSTLNVVGHMDDAIGNLYAKRLATAFGCKVVVTCGVHFDSVDAVMLKGIQTSAVQLLTELEVQLRDSMPSPPPQEGED